MTGFEFVVRCREAIEEDKVFLLGDDVIYPRFAKLITHLYEGMPCCDRDTFFKQSPEDIVAAIRLSLSGNA